MSKVTTHTQFRLRQQNRDVVAQLRKLGIFRSNEDVVDAALRMLVDSLKKEFGVGEKRAAAADDAIEAMRRDLEASKASLGDLAPPVSEASSGEEKKE